MEDRKSSYMTPAGALVGAKEAVVPAESLDCGNLFAWESYLALGLSADEYDRVALWTCRTAEMVDSALLDAFEDGEVVLAACALLSLADAITATVADAVDAIPRTEEKEESEDEE